MKFRKATHHDVPAIIGLLADDPLGSKRDDPSEPLASAYYQAFERIHDDPNQELMVVEAEDDGIIATFQLSFIQYLNYKGGLRAQVECVHVRHDHRGKGLGEEVFRWIIERARTRKARLLQLTSDKQRPEALRFYSRVGFIASHEGLKLHLEGTPVSL